MPKECVFADTMRLLRDPAFADTAREAIRDYVSWREVAGRPLPEGLAPEEYWQLLTTVRRLGATTFPIPATTGDTFWYTLTIDGRRCLRAIERHCRSDARLHQMVRHRTGQRFLVASHIRESIATCKNDGVEADTAELARMLSEGRTPRTPEGRLVRNTYEMLGELESLVGEDFSPELVGHLHERVIHGVDPGSLKRSGSRLRAVPSIFREIVKDHLPPGIESARSRPPDVAEDVLRQICDYANGTTGDPREPVAVKGYMVLASMGYWHPLPDFNATVARHMLRLLSVKSDFPVLGYLPTSVMLRRWSKGTLDPGTVRYETIEPGIPVEDGLDGTAEILVHLQLTAAAVNELRALIRSTKEEDEALGTTLRDAERFNYRQRDVLKQALRRPDTEFTLREHRLKHRTVYSTARADLIELAESGLLEKHVRGQAFVFTPAPDLRERLSHAGEDDRE